MANKERGEVAVKTLDGAEYTAAPKHGALCVLMTEFKKKPPEIFNDALDGDPFAMRAAIWSYMQRYHSDVVPTFESADDFIDRIGGALGVMKLIGDVGRVNLEIHGIKVPDENPLKAQTGPGEISSSPLAEPV